MGARVWRGRRTAGGCRGQESEVSQEARSSQLECRCRALCARHGPNVVPCAETDQDTAATLICVNPAAFSKPTLTLAFLTLPLHFLVTRVNNRRMPKTLIVPKWQQNCEKLLVGIVPKRCSHLPFPNFFFMEICHKTCTVYIVHPNCRLLGKFFS